MLRTIGLWLLSTAMLLAGFEGLREYDRQGLATAQTPGTGLQMPEDGTPIPPR